MASSSPEQEHSHGGRLAVEQRLRLTIGMIPLMILRGAFAMRRSAFTTSFLAVIVCVCPAQALAFPVTWEFAGEVTSVRDDENLLGGAVIIGTPFSGSFTFETTTPDFDPSDRNVGWYFDALTSMTGEVGGVPFSSTGRTAEMVSSFVVVDDSRFDGSDAYSIEVTTQFADRTAELFLILVDATGGLINDISLPIDPPMFDALTSSSFRLVYGEAALDVRGVLTSVVPEPGTLSLFALGTAILLCRRSKGEQS